MGTPFVQLVTVVTKYVDSEIQIQKVLGFIYLFFLFFLGGGGGYSN